MQHLLGDMSPATFLRDYWQKKPLLIRRGIPNMKSPIDRDELAGMAMEEAVESRLVRENGGQYELDHGPFGEETLTKLPSSHWSLLVQDVDKFLPEIAQYRDLVNFIPQWRMDDIMISYAADQGSVGPHTDLYDVFLVQAEGRRRWQIDSRPDGDRSIDPEQQLRVLRKFSPTDEWVLEPGDVLYLPPGVPHHGVALGNCMTWSFGFRAPAYRDLSESIGALLAENWLPDELYGDKELLPVDDPSEISRAAVDQIRQVLLTKWNQADWDRILGCILTGHKSNCAPSLPDLEDMPSAEEVNQALLAGCMVVRDPAARMAHISHGKQSDLFANGEVVATGIPTAVAKQLCCLPPTGQLKINTADLQIWQPLMTRLLSMGLLSLD